MVEVEGNDFPDHLFYDMDNQIWYEPLGDGTVRAGFTAWGANLMGEVLVFTPKRLGREFEKGRSFAVVEGGKWVGSARAAFDGVVVSHNESLQRTPELLNIDSYRAGWMLIVRPLHSSWHERLVTGAAIAPAFAAWLGTGAYKNRTD
jgi:glycine cleavage system H protein